MTRPLIVSDCDEVLLYMVAPFRGWLAEVHGVRFHMEGGDFGRAMRYARNGEAVAEEEIWRLLNLFFDAEMHRQLPVPGVIEAMTELRRHADVVVLTNLKDHRQADRTRQLAGHGLDFRVYTNQGPKGPALAAILDEYRPSNAVFIDDIAQHHGSVAETAPHVHRLHLCAEPQLAPHIACAHKAGHAHARIDTWEHALPWLLARLEEETIEETSSRT